MPLINVVEKSWNFLEKYRTRIYENTIDLLQKAIKSLRKSFCIFQFFKGYKDCELNLKLFYDTEV